MAELVVCCAAEDRERVRPIALALGRRGWRVGIMSIAARPGPLPAAAQETVRDCKAVVVVWTRTAARRALVHEVAELARSERTLLPVRIEPILPRNHDVPPRPIELIDWDGDPGAPGWRRIIARIRTLVGPPPDETVGRVPPRIDTPLPGPTARPAAVAEAGARPPVRPAPTAAPDAAAHAEDVDDEATDIAPPDPDLVRAAREDDQAAADREPTALREEVLWGVADDAPPRAPEAADAVAAPATPDAPEVVDDPSSEGDELELDTPTPSAVLPAEMPAADDEPPSRALAADTASDDGRDEPAASDERDVADDDGADVDAAALDAAEAAMRAADDDEDVVDPADASATFPDLGGLLAAEFANGTPGALPEEAAVLAAAAADHSRTFPDLGPPLSAPEVAAAAPEVAPAPTPPAPPALPDLPPHVTTAQVLPAGRTAPRMPPTAQPARRRTGVWVLGALCLALLVAGGAAWWFGQSAPDAAPTAPVAFTPPPPPPPPPAPGADAPAAEVAPTSEGLASVDDGRSGAPLSAESARRARLERAAPEVADLVTRGWELIDDGKMARAVPLFEQALALEAANVDANYGIGYAQVHLGQLDGGVDHMCKARPGLSTQEQREVTGFLGRRGRSCATSP